MGDNVTLDTFATELRKPVSSAIDPGIAAAIAAAPAAVSVITQVDANAIPAGDGYAEDLPEAARLHTRAGGAKGAGEFRLDLGEASAQRALADGVLADLAEQGFEGAQLEGLTGGRGEPGYDSMDGERSHVPHGGAYRTQGARRAAAAARESLPVLTAGAVQEGALDVVDLSEQGTQITPGLGECAAEALLATGVAAADVEAQARHLSPPIWSIIYGPLSQSGRHVAALVDAARDTSPFATTAWPGLTESELCRVLAFSIASVAINGHLPMHRMPLELASFRLAETHDVVRFAARVQAALSDGGWLAPYLRDGTSEEPLARRSDWSHGFRTRSFGSRNTCAHPYVALQKINPAIYGLVAPPGAAQWRAAGQFSSGFSRGFRRGPASGATGWDCVHSSFQVPQILSSLWRSGTDLCLAMMNPRDVAGSLGGRLVPWARAGWGGNFSHGFSRGFSSVRRWSVYRLDGGLSAWSGGFSGGFGGSRGRVLVRSGLHGRVSFECSGTEGDLSPSGRVLYLGDVQPYAVKGYLFTQE